MDECEHYETRVLRYCGFTPTKMARILDISLPTATARFNDPATLKANELKLMLEELHDDDAREMFLSIIGKRSA